MSAAIDDPDESWFDNPILLLLLLLVFPPAALYGFARSLGMEPVVAVLIVLVVFGSGTKAGCDGDVNLKTEPSVEQTVPDSLATDAPS